MVDNSFSTGDVPVGVLPQPELPSGFKGAAPPGWEDTRPGAASPGYTPPPVKGVYNPPQYSFDTDPSVALARALENQGIGQLDAWLKSAREQAIIQSGDPALASIAGFGLDPQAGVFAQQNYLSGNADLARVARARDLAKKAIINRLASRGLLRSGDLGYLEGQANIDYGNQEYDVRQNVLKKLADLMAQYLQQKQALKQNTVSAYQSAFNNVANNPGLLGALSQQSLQEFLNS